jgi:hypothetical protein
VIASQSSWLGKNTSMAVINAKSLVGHVTTAWQENYSRMPPEHAKAVLV